MGRSKGRETSIKDNWKCVTICLAMALANCQYGYDTATIGGFQGNFPLSVGDNVLMGHQP